MVVRTFDFDNLQKVNFGFDFIQKGKRMITECRNIITFDIETSNGYYNPLDNTIIGWDNDYYDTEDGENYYKNSIKVSLMYIWQCAVESGDDIYVFMGRTWDDYDFFVNLLSDEIAMATSERDRKLRKVPNTKTIQAHCYIHNLGFEFQHLRNIWNGEMKDVFAREARNPMRFIIKKNKVKWAYHDTLVLTQKSLNAWGKDENLQVKKIKEPDDYYDAIRTPETELTEEELMYSENDVVTMVYGMRKFRDKYVTLDNIVMTQTGAVRRTLEKNMSKNRAWCESCKIITANIDFEMYTKKLTAIFAGGWTHGNKLYQDKLLKNLRQFDLASAYPAVACNRTYPVGEFVKCTEKEIVELTKQPIHDRTHHYFVEFEATNIASKTWNTFWSLSKCIKCEDVTADNGKIENAKYIRAIMTDLDFELFNRVYEIESLKIIEGYKAKADYLPVEMVSTILEYFQYKTSLKGDPEKESLYNESKQFINSIYGLMCTKLFTDPVTFISDWETLKGNPQDFYETIARATKEKKLNYTTYQCGCWIPAWVRVDCLWRVIEKLDSHIVYCDTDSEKGMFDANDIEEFKKFNELTDELNLKAATKLGLPVDLWTAKTIKNKTKHLGYFEEEDLALEFKFLRSKAYCYSYMENNEKHIKTTIAGLPKSAGAAKVKEVKDFSTNLKWKPSESHKKTAYYNDCQPLATWIDRDGNKFVSIDQYGICIMPVSYDLSISNDFEVLCDVVNQTDYSIYRKQPELLREIISTKISKTA